MVLQSVVLSLLGLSALPAQAVELGRITSSGSGCPQGTVSATLAPDRKSFTVLLDQAQIEIGKSSGKSYAMQTCNLDIPIFSAPGKTWVIQKLDYRGYRSLPAGAKATVSLGFSMRKGYPGREEVRSVMRSEAAVFNGPSDDVFTASRNITNPDRRWACGQPVRLTVGAHWQLQGSAFGDDALLALDSVDGTMTYGIEEVDCAPTTPPPPPAGRAEYLIQCQSISRTEATYCLAGGDVLDVLPYAIITPQLCRPGSLSDPRATYGRSGVHVWTRGGCRGIFKAVVIPRAPFRP